ncbi:hypothetical protein AYO40_03095 [Planctomycetaceae bacterium SCGC AG-212-D15]|nr:hypothetical protein AYO40_03095 [Planctomycetaceae bacterium SCGC AG-212-D15]
MCYDPTYSDQAEEDVAKLPIELLGFVESNLLVLCRQPVSLSRPSVFPYPPRCQLFHFHHPDFDGNRHDFTVLFRYFADEKALYVLGIGHYERGIIPSDEPPAL